MKMKRILSRRQLQHTVRGLAHHIRADYEDTRPVLIGVLKGSFVFLADLVRELNMPLENDFVAVSIYEQGRVSNDEVTLTKTSRRIFDTVPCCSWRTSWTAI